MEKIKELDVQDKYNVLEGLVKEMLQIRQTAPHAFYPPPEAYQQYEQAAERGPSR
jgi:hypothetical protein